MIRISIAKDFTRRRFQVRFVTHSLSCVGFFSVLAGIVSALFPKVLPPNGAILAGVAMVVSVVYGLYRSWSRPVWQSYQLPNTEIHVVVGDLFEQEGNIVVGMADTFDTEPPHIIERHGVQAQLLERFYHGDRSALDNSLVDALAGVERIGEFAPEDGKAGKQVIYPVGTVAAIAHTARRLVFCVAYTQMNSRCEARGSVDGVWRSLTNLWDEVRARGNGDPISIAVIGGGQARIAQYLPAQDSIRFIALSYMFASRKEKVASRLNIVVRPSDVDRLDMLELQAFLKSLRPS